MNEEEKKAIEKLKETQDSYLKDELDLAIETVINLLEKKDRQIEELEKRLCNHDEIISRLEEENTRKDKKIKELEADNYECNNIINDFIDGNKELIEKLGIDNANDKKLVKYYEQAYREAREREDNFYMKSHRRQIDMANARIEVRKGILSMLEE